MSESGSSVSDQVASLCLKCSKTIILSPELEKSLAEETTRQIITRRGSTRTLHCLQCRICQHQLKDSSTDMHLKEHYIDKEIFYCLDCQNEINDISIQRLPEPYYRNSFLGQVAESSRLIGITKDDLYGCGTPNPSLEPKCGRCGRVFDYIRPLLHKLVDSNIKIFETEDGMICADTCFICCLCEKAEVCLSVIQHHVLQHVQYGDVFCRACKYRYSTGGPANTKRNESAPTSSKKKEYPEMSIQRQITEKFYDTYSPYNMEGTEKLLQSHHGKSIVTSDNPAILQTTITDEKSHQFSQIVQSQLVPSLAASDIKSLSPKIASLEREIPEMTKPYETTDKVFPTYDPNSICRNCNDLIIFSDKLVQSLIRETKTLSQANSMEIVSNFKCRICDRHLREGFQIYHMKNHDNAKELYYCLTCQLQINDISIEPFPELKPKGLITKDGTFFSLIETKKVELQGVAAPDPSVEPHCGKCGRIFDYVGPLLHKVLDSTVTIYKTQTGSLSVEGYYICCLCEKGEYSIHIMQHHALKHVQNGDILCKVCQESAE